MADPAYKYLQGRFSLLRGRFSLSGQACVVLAVSTKCSVASIMKGLDHHRGRYRKPKMSVRLDDPRSAVPDHKWQLYAAVEPAKSFIPRRCCETAASCRRNTFILISQLQLLALIPTPRRNGSVS